LEVTELPGEPVEVVEKEESEEGLVEIPET
jgi:hypothetical protein